MMCKNLRTSHVLLGRANGPSIGGRWLSLILGSVFVFVGCKNPYSSAVGGGEDSQVQSPSITHPEGDGHRCDGIYPEVYAVMQPHFASVVSLWDDAKGEVKPEVTNGQARAIVERTIKMLHNIMGMRARPIHPIAFFSVIKHFESSMDMIWSGGGESEGGTEKFSYSSPWGPMCDTNGKKTDCMGLFQINLFDSDMTLGLQSKEIAPAFKAICGQGGLNLLGTKGSLDTCASLYWWLRNEAYKCGLMLKGSQNACTDATNAQGVYPWSPDTFAYAHSRAYKQENQLIGHNKNDPWRALYVGGRAPAGARITHFMGYEHCAARHYLKQFSSTAAAAEKGSALALDLEKGARKLTSWVSRNAAGGYDIIREIKANEPENFNLTRADAAGGITDAAAAEINHPKQDLLRAAVGDFAQSIGITPWWYDGWWQSGASAPKASVDAYEHGKSTEKTAPYFVNPQKPH